jgi:iron complex transport system permease protein
LALILGTCLVFSLLLAIGVGRYPISPLQILSIIATGGEAEKLSSAMVGPAQVLMNIRLPRIVATVLVGASLGAAGATYQGLFRNPLVSPDILGVSQGASFGAAMAILLGQGSLLPIQVSAFVFGLLAVILSYGISRIRGGSTAVMLVLAGVVVSALFAALLSFVQYLADPYTQLPAIQFWLMGGFHTVTWERLSFALPGIIAGSLFLLAFRWRINVLSLGDEEAYALGINAARQRAVFVACATLVVTSGVSVAGVVGWVGLVLPHIGRMLAGPNYRWLLPISMLLGGTFLTITDTLARSVSTAEIPISILTSFLGAPFFAWLLRRNQASVWRA